MAIQFEFDFTEADDESAFIDVPVEPELTAEIPPSTSRPLTRRNLKRAVLAWLVGKQASAIAPQVPTRVTQFKADVAAMWCGTTANPAPVGPRRILTPTRTAVVECRLTRDECWPDCANSDELSPKLKALHDRRTELQASIRQDEPQLRRGDTLFEEMADWDYDDTSNLEYHQIRRKIRKLEEALYKGTRFEGIRRLRIADLAYLAVPTGVIEPHELAEGWGLLWVNNRLQVEVVADAEELECLVENRVHLSQNIALACRDSVLFANGIRERQPKPEFLHLPRRRLKPQDFTEA